MLYRYRFEHGMWDALRYEYDYEMWATILFIHFPRKYGWQEFCNCTHVQHIFFIHFPAQIQLARILRLYTRTAFGRENGMGMKGEKRIILKYFSGVGVKENKIGKK